ncbi:MAG TPA: hypothetical protein PK385_11725 [Spirochaetota bacterium]|nr:MAG: hypothetical protein BWX91_02471 [Spirochaetes bacterium ADurb.Bin133]HNZ28055.1 hypothetical protein [Spirochaetota bacterium]HOF01630.1 hypothetical protein [Spirochaetota bacterium]HOS33640.1 hypothetical protein [Spirochaetota bacterium]HOS56711.1 hypothetical protein [Spirochaetota bacterium]
MNYTNIIIIVSALTISIMFFGGVFMNLGIKSSREELIAAQREIKELKDDIKRYEIEIASLSSPVNIINFINTNNLKTIPIKRIKVIRIKE